jgi:signal transduction histidine kinase
MVVNTLLIFILLCVALSGAYAATWFRIEQTITQVMAKYAAMSVDLIGHRADNAKLFVSTIDASAYEYVQDVVDSNIFKYFNTLYANDYFSTSQTDRILSKIINESGGASTIRVDENYYRYAKHQMNANTIQIVVLDTTDDLRALRSMRDMLLFIAAGSLVLILFVSKFITDRSIKPIEEMHARQMDFFADISHELKTPLTIAITNLAVVESHKEQTVESQEKWLGFLKEQLARLSNLVNEMIYLESIALHNAAHRKQKIDLSALLIRYIKSLAVLIEERQLLLNLDIENDVYFYAETEAMTRLISVLVDNAIKYTPEGGTIAVVLSQSGKRIVFSVRNSGEGIESAHFPRLFDRLYRVQKGRSTNDGGKGLGLAIAKSVVERYNGTISVQSELGQYTTFTVALPKDFGNTYRMLAK